MALAYEVGSAQDPFRHIRNPAKYYGYDPAASKSYADQAGAEWAKMQSQISSLLKQINSRPTAPTLPFETINAQARKAATSAVNPLYVKRLNTFLAQQKAKETQKRGQSKIDVANIEDVLKRSLETSGIERGRVGEDTATNLAEIADQADIYQTDAGQQFEQGREALGQEIASTGMGPSGLGGQRVAQATEQQNVAEERQTQQFEQARTQQQLFKTRSFEDLLRGDELAKSSAGKGREQVKFDLDSYIKLLGFETKAGREELEESRLQRLAAEEERQRSSLVSKFIQGIGNAGQRQAAYQAYGSFL